MNQTTLNQPVNKQLNLLYKKYNTSKRQIGLLLDLYKNFSESKTITEFGKSTEQIIVGKHRIANTALNLDAKAEAQQDLDDILYPLMGKITAVGNPHRATMVFLENNCFTRLSELEDIAKMTDPHTSTVVARDGEQPRRISSTTIKEHAQTSAQHFSCDFDKLFFMLHDESQA